MAVREGDYHVHLQIAANLVASTDPSTNRDYGKGSGYLDITEVVQKSRLDTKTCPPIYSQCRRELSRASSVCVTTMMNLKFGLLGL